MQKRSDRSSRRPAAAVGNGRPVMQLEGLEDRRLMSVVTPATPQTAVRLETSLGRITLLLKDATPLTVANFLHYVNGEGDNKNLYNGTIVHRSIPGFVIQLGGYKAGTSGYTHIPTQDAVVNEFAAAKAAVNGGDVNTRGTVALALSGGNNNTGQSEFFINLANNAHSTASGTDNGLDVQSGGFTTFAKVIGGGMHVADAIAGLKTTNASFLNPAFSDLPVIQTATGPNPVTLSSAKAQSSLVVRIDNGAGANSTKFVTWVDEKGGTTTVTLSKGTADLTFVGGNDMQIHGADKGNHIYITGKNVSLEDLTTHGTTKSSVLAIKATGGNGPAHIGNVTVANGSLGSIAANTIQLQGDITAANGSIGSIDLQGTYRSTILTNGGSLSVKIGTAFDTSVNTKGTLKSLVAQRWQDDGQIPTSIVAGTLNSMEVNGNFSSNITTTGNVNRIKINGNVGTLGHSTWTINGSVNNVQAGKVMGLNLHVGKSLSTFTAREVLNSADGGTTAVEARSIGRMTLATLTNQSTIAARNGNIGNVAIAGLMDSSTIRATGNIGSVSALSIAGTNPGGTAGALIPSRIFAGVRATEPNTDPATKDTIKEIPVTDVTKASHFLNYTATIGSIKVQKTFSNTNIAAPIYKDLNLGTVQAASTQQFGVIAHTRIGHLGATIKGKAVNLNNATNNEAVQNYFTGIGLPLTNATDGNRFTVKFL